MKIILMLLLLTLPSFGFQISLHDNLESFMRGDFPSLAAHEGIKCGTQYDILIHEHQNQLDPELFQAYHLKTRIQPTRTDSMLSPSGNFMLHWNEGIDIHAVPPEDLDSEDHRGDRSSRKCNQFLLPTP